MVTGRVVSRGFLGTSGKAKCQGGCCGEMLLPRGYRLDPALRKVRMPTGPQSHTHFAFPVAAALAPFIPSLRDAATKLDSLQARGTTW